jgi:Uncharacterized protein conserved in bacteria (DUF2252)
VNIIESTQSYEAWLSDQTELQKRGIEKKHEMMASGPFPFLRATFYRWIQKLRKECSDLYDRDEDVLLAVGDLHVENFGIWRDSRERLVWGVNDFDEACQLPFTIDLVRLGTSIILAAEAAKIEAPIDKVAEFLIAGYQDGLKAGGKPILLDEGDYHGLLALVCCVKEDPAAFWARKLDDDENPEIAAKDLPGWLADIFDSAFPPGVKLGYRRERKPGGLGSLGRRRYIAFSNKNRNHCIAREAKTLVPSALSWLQKRSDAKSLTATLLQRAVRSPDPWLQVHDRWLVRQLAPDAVKIELPASQEDARLVFAPDLIRAMGFETANIHLGSRSPGELQAAMDRLRQDLGGDWLIAATGRMAKVTRQDHLEWSKHWNRHSGARR